MVDEDVHFFGTKKKMLLFNVKCHFHGMLPLRHDHKNGVNSHNHHTPKMCRWDYSHPQIDREKYIPTNLMAIYLSIYIWGLITILLYDVVCCLIT